MPGSFERTDHERRSVMEEIKKLQEEELKEITGGFPNMPRPKDAMGQVVEGAPLVDSLAGKEGEVVDGFRLIDKLSKSGGNDKVLQ